MWIENFQKKNSIDIYRKTGFIVSSNDRERKKRHMIGPITSESM